MNKDQVKGSVDQATGKTKEAIGKAVGNKDLENKGKMQHAGGKVRKGSGDVKESIDKSF